MEVFEDGVRFQLSERQPFGSSRMTNVMMIFNGAQTVITEGKRYFVEAVVTTAHGDTRTQSTRSEFMGLERSDVGQLVGIFDNLEGRWCIVRRLDGKTADVRAKDLKMISEPMFDELKKLYETRKRIRDAKPVQFTYTTNLRDIPLLQTDTPIVPDSTISIRVDAGYRSYNVRTVSHQFALVDGVALCAGTQVILDSI